jgi:hypothetical protein
MDYTLKMFRDSKGKFHTFYSSALDEDEYSPAQCSIQLNPRARIHRLHCKGGWVDPRPGLVVVMKRKI